ncbi:hypothetical protein [Mycobacterium botniense]|uniref:Uncharacterized protein n=1 Tax=Mycobacterium botniense TaxID=84962 RepID=A0A7I9Y1F9_9MYCO|nr:hypothetical protein [Mycobacterium botniense]GFG75896.1 hypothetical protein MBOT_32610 [Mycobacterium botniense]
MPELNPEQEAAEVEEPTWLADGPTQAGPTEAAELPPVGFAWSAEPEMEPERSGWSAVALKLLAPALAVMLGAAGATVALLFTGHHGNLPAGPFNTPGPSAAAPPAASPPTSESPPVVAVPPLDGTYRLDFDGSKLTYNGEPDPIPNDSIWMAFRSACTAAGCVATGTKLDPKNLQAASSSDYYLLLHWIDGRWEGEHTGPSECSTGIDMSALKQQTEFDTISLVPQSDGTYLGTYSWTIQDNECGQQGSVRNEPFVAWRTGPAPPGVVADPPTQPSLPQTPTYIQRIQPTTEAAPSITFDRMRDFVTELYALLPAQPMAAWAQFDTHFQTKSGLSAYLEFWATIQSVTVLSVSPRDGTSVVVRLKYVRKDGKSDTEDRWLSVVSVNGQMLVDDSERIG